MGNGGILPTPCSGPIAMPNREMHFANIPTLRSRSLDTPVTYQHCRRANLNENITIFVGNTLCLLNFLTSLDTVIGEFSTFTGPISCK